MKVDIYKLLKLYQRIDSPRIKLLGLLLMHLAHRRYSGMFFDPALSCNLRCRMCYMSDEDKRKEMHGSFSIDDLKAIAKAAFPYMLKLQIGCGAEPTVHRNLADVVKLGREYGVPYISITTNGMLLTREKLEELVSNGLNEITLSVHGLTKETYEFMMQGADFDKWLALLCVLKDINKDERRLKIRINYTVNEDNADDLRLLPNLMSDLHIDVIQIRPIQKIGDSSYSNFSKTGILQKYDECILNVVKHFESKGTLCLYPTKENIAAVDGDDSTDTRNSVVSMIPHFYLSPFDGWRQEFDPYEEDFYGYCKRNKRVKYMLKNLFFYRPDTYEDVTKSMNYQIK